MRPGLRVAQLLNIAFDMGAWELLGAMANGSTLCLRGNTSAEWRRVLAKVDIVIATPSVLAQHYPATYPNIMNVIVGGETCPQGQYLARIDHAEYQLTIQSSLTDGPATPISTPVAVLQKSVSQTQSSYTYLANASALGPPYRTPMCIFWTKSFSHACPARPGRCGWEELASHADISIYQRRLRGLGGRIHSWVTDECSIPKIWLGGVQMGNWSTSVASIIKSKSK